MECSVMADAAISRKVKLGGGLSVELTMSRSGAICEWSPSMPKQAHKTPMAKIPQGKE